MLSDRQNKILKLITEEYIKTATPVGSKTICQDLNCSSATVRNEMAYLEEAGMLEKTHTSSGRLPSDKGYHYYVNHLMEADKISGSDMLKLQQIFSNQSLQLSDCIKLSLELVAGITEYAALKLGEASLDARVKEISSVPLNKDEIVMIIVTDKGFVEHKNVSIQGLDAIEIKKTIKLISDLIVGTELNKVLSKLEFDVKPVIGAISKQQETLYNVIYNVFDEIRERQDRYVSGERNFLKMPEYKSNAEKIDNILSKLDDLDYDIKEENDDINIYIGKETELDDNLAVIRTSYNTDKEKGSIAIIGPKRMAYDKVLPLLDFIKQNIESGDKNE